jgi:wobble nucleotide-excising tRNase
MIRRVAGIKNLGIFRDYKWDGDLQDFCRYNLIYGWNGAGKTTLSRLFAALSAGELLQHPNLTYEVITDSQSWRQGTECTERIRVFNRDYVLANIEKVGGPSPIFILGAENREISQHIAQDEESLAAKLLRLAQLEDGHKALTKRRNQLFTDIARTIGQNVSGGESTRSYRRPDAGLPGTGLEGAVVGWGP